MNRLLILLAVAALSVGCACWPCGKSCKSDAVKDAQYQADSQTLTVKFPSGSTYQYSGVPQAVYDGLQKAESKGQYFNTEIKGKFESKKVGP
jgi:hypothetical protein